MKQGNSHPEVCLQGNVQLSDRVVKIGVNQTGKTILLQNFDLSIFETYESIFTFPKHFVINNLFGT